MKITTTASVLAVLIVAALAPAVATHENNLSVYYLAHTPSPAVQGEAVTFGAEVYTGRFTPTTFDVEFLVDNVSIGVVTVTSEYYWVWVESAPWTAVAGKHRVTAIVDPDNAINESSETDNRATREFPVYTGLADLTAHIEVSKVPLVTDVGAAPTNPIQRHRIEATVCNEGSIAPEYGGFYVEAQSARPLAGTASRDFIGSGSVSGIAPGECRTYSFVWDGLGSFGDIEFVASASGHPERDLSDNTARAASFAYVGGVSGFILPLP